MIQWYDDRPEGPEEAFIWFETLFRKQFLAEQASKERKLEYVLRLLVARRELQLQIFSQWPTEYTAEKLQNEIVANLVANLMSKYLRPSKMKFLLRCQN
jgi:hypothetical protein